jgi:hypothetical protein
VRIKLDENIGKRGRELLRQCGHDVLTVYDQGLCGIADDRLFDICSNEDRVLVTLDRDFGEILRFPPSDGAGLVVLDLGPRATPTRILDRLADFISVAETHDVGGKLWIVEPGRVRIHVDGD